MPRKRSAAEGAGSESSSPDGSVRSWMNAVLMGRARLPLGQVAGLLGTTIVVVAGLVWQVHSILSPIETNITALQWQVTQLRANSEPVRELALRRWVIGFEDGRPADGRQSTSDLSEIGFKLKENPDLIAVVIGHTNNDQPMQQAIALGASWANQLATEIRSTGVDPSRILVRSMGFQRPLALPDDRSNARVEIVLVNLRSFLIPGGI